MVGFVVCDLHGCLQVWWGGGCRRVCECGFVMPHVVDDVIHLDQMFVDVVGVDGWVEVEGLVGLEVCW